LAGVAALVALQVMIAKEQKLFMSVSDNFDDPNLFSSQGRRFICKLYAFRYKH
jgi:hypothetical protein